MPWLFIGCLLVIPSPRSCLKRLVRVSNQLLQLRHEPHTMADVQAAAKEVAAVETE
jgi:hypothetical protein